MLPKFSIFHFLFFYFLFFLSFQNVQYIIVYPLQCTIFCRDFLKIMIYALFKESYQPNSLPIGKLYVFSALLTSLHTRMDTQWCPVEELISIVGGEKWMIVEDGCDGHTVMPSGGRKETHKIRFGNTLQSSLEEDAGTLSHSSSTTIV